MSNFFLFVLLFLVSCRSYNDVLIEFKEDGSVVETPVYREIREQGSGMGLTPHLRLGPHGNHTVLRPNPPDVHTPPPVNSGENGTPINIPVDDPGTPETPSTFNCTVVFVNQTQAEKDKYNTACLMIERIVPTASFKEDVEDHISYNGSVGYYGSSSTCDAAGELGNVGAALYTHIRNGDERKPAVTAIDNEMDMKVEMYRDDSSSTIGYTYATSDQIWVNRKYSDGYKPSSIASNLFHEWLHKMGYGHSSASTVCRPYSIPYAVGYMIRDYASPLNDDYGY